jgi:hypothetical protein
MSSAENTAKIQRGKPFEKGKSGNPTGKPKGALNKTTMAVQKMLDGEAENLTRTAIELAKDGNVIAMRLCMERIMAPRKDRPEPFVLSENGLLEQVQTILRQVADGELTPMVASEIVGIIATAAKVEEIDSLRAEVTALKGILNARKTK